MAKITLLTEDKRTLLDIFGDGKKTGYTPELFEELLKLYEVEIIRNPNPIRAGLPSSIRIAVNNWKNFDYKNATELIKKIFPDWFHTIIDYAIPPGIKETEQKIKSVKETPKPKEKKKPDEEK